MKKKRYALLIILLALILAGVAGVVYLGYKNGKEQPQETEEPEEEQGEEITGETDFRDLGNIYYLPEDTAEFENQVSGFLRQSGISASQVRALTKFEDDRENPSGTAVFYLQADDEKRTVIQVQYDKGREEFSFSIPEQTLENPEDYGGEEKPEQTPEDVRDEPEYSTQGTEEIDLGDPRITDSDESLEAVGADLEALSGELLNFLLAEEEERRNVIVLSADGTETGGYVVEFLFENPRTDGKYIEAVYDPVSGYQIAWKE